MTHKIVFLDRESLDAKVKPFSFPHEYVEHDSTWTPDEIVERLAGASIAIIKHAYARYNLALGAGLSQVAGKVFRIGHVGDLNELSLLGAIAGAEMSMLDNGVKVQPGSGVAAASSYLRENPLAKT